MTAASSKMVCALVGFPNAGKSSLFNALTGQQQKTGNWSGVTVSAKRHCCADQAHSTEWVDLPGLQDLQAISATQEGALDEDITRQFLNESQLDLLVNVVDMTHLERHLYLTMQLRELGRPMLVVLNKMDVAKKQGIDIDLESMAQWLQCPVVTASQEQCSHKSLAPAVAAALQQQASSAFQLTYAPQTEGLLRAEQQAQPTHSRAQALATLLAQAEPNSHGHHQTQGCFDVEVDIVSTRYRAVETFLAATMPQQPVKTWDSRLDAVVLHPWLGVPIFIGVMYLMFMFSIHIGGAFQDFFEIIGGTLFVDAVSVATTSLGLPIFVTDVLANGVGLGIQTVLTFIPIISSLFFILSALEISGYFSRAAFVVDGFMQKVGLPGKAFVPMIVGFGCSVPAIMATRSLNKKRERLLAGMMAPFMSCSARLPVYALFAATFFAEQAHFLVLALYVIGILAALLTGWLLSKTMLPVCQSDDLLELPGYQLPKLRTVLRQAYRRTTSFVTGSGKIIVLMVTLLTIFDSIPVAATNDHDATTVLQKASQKLTYLFEPMGIAADNWPATVGLVTGFFAKEAVVGSLIHLYQTEDDTKIEAQWPSFSGRFQEALTSISINLGALALSAPLAIGQELDATNSVHVATRAAMATAFGSTAAAFAYVIFILLYTPCVSAIGALVQEFGKSWACFSALWSFFLAYAVATACYQVATLIQHAWFSSLWLVGLGVVFWFIYRLLARLAPIKHPQHLISMIEIN